MHRWYSVFSVLVFAVSLLPAGSPQPAGAQPNAVSLKMAPDVFELPCTIREVHFHVEEDMSEASGDSLRVRRVRTNNGQRFETQNSRKMKFGNPEF